MKNTLKNILILTLFGCCVFSSAANAITKLDFFAAPESLMKRLERLQHKYEEEYNKNMNDLQEKVLHASGAEGSVMYIMMQKQLDGFVSGSASTLYQQIKTGRFDTSAFTDMYKLKGSSLLELKQIQTAIEDYDEAKRKERKDKVDAIQTRLMVLKTMITDDPAVKADPEKQTEIALEIASLEEQIKALELEVANEDKQRDALELQFNQAREKVKFASSYEEYLMGKASEKIDHAAAGLFPQENEEDTNAENEALYGADINKLFLLKNEPERAETKARVKKARDTEYYQAVQNVLRATTASLVASNDIEETSKAYTNNTTEVDGLYGGMSMKIGADIQTAKAAARYTELLLAGLRLASMSEIRQWNSIYKLNDYNKDITTLNLDEYVYKESSLLDTLKDKAQSTYQKEKDKIVQKGMQQGENLLNDQINDWLGQN